MSTTKTKTELTRLAWIAALRREGNRKCEGYYFWKGTNLVCALGLLHEVSGESEAVEWFTPCEVGAMAGLTEMQSREVASRNDGTLYWGDDDDFVEVHKHSFGEIADIVESWFK